MNRSYSPCCTTVVREIGIREHGEDANAFRTNCLGFRNPSSITTINAVESHSSRSEAQNAQNRTQQQGLESESHVR